MGHSSEAEAVGRVAPRAPSRLLFPQRAINDPPLYRGWSQL